MGCSGSKASTAKCQQPETGKTLLTDPASTQKPADVHIKAPTSKIITAPKDWCDAGLLIPHEAIRMMLNEMCKFRLDSDDKLAAFSKWYSQIFYVVVHHHHDAEEQIYMPWLTKKVPFPPDAKVEDEHKALMALMNTLRSSAAEATKDTAADLKAKLQELVDLMHSHLHAEEKVVPEMLRSSGYTQEEEGAIIGQIVEGLGPDNAIFIPIITEAMDRAGGYGPMNSEFFVSLLPPPVQEGLPGWVKAFREENLKVMEFLQETTYTESV